MKKILTIFPNAENVHLTKDVGMVPFVLHKHFGYDATLACYNKGPYPNLLIETPGLKILHITRFTGIATLDTAFFLLLNSWKFDILIAFHYSFFTGINVAFFKLLNSFSKKKIAYVKLDTKEDIFVLKNKKLLRWLFNFADITSTEIKSIFSDLQKDFKNLIYLPNGFYPKFEASSNAKSNIFLTVGRIGSPEKANDVLLQAFAMIASDLPDWNLSLVGPIESEFESYISSFFKSFPHLINRIELTGPIYNKNELRVKYHSAKIFVLPSKWEGFPLVFLEAGIAGCTIVSSAILPAKDVTNDEEFGKIFPIDDIEALADILVKLANDEAYLQSNSLAISKFYSQNFYWPEILEKVNERFKALLKL